MEEEIEEFVLLPPGSVIFEPFKKHVTILFPTEDDAIVYHEFLRSFISGEIELEAKSK